MNKYIFLLLVVSFFFCFLNHFSYAQRGSLWHGKERAVRYHPEGDDIVINNGTKRFTRALYGSNTAFRVEAGDLPEFALYLPGMGGNLKFGLIRENKSKWLIDAKNIKASYRAGSMLYEIRDTILGDGSLFITVLAMADKEGVIVRMEARNIPPDIKLLYAFGGATGTRFSRDGDIGADPESSFYLKSEYCRDNRFQLNKNTFNLFFGSKKLLSEDDRYEIKHLPGQTQPTPNPPPGSKKISGIFPPSAVVKIADANQQANPLKLYNSEKSLTPVLVALTALQPNNPLYFFIQVKGLTDSANYDSLPQMFADAEQARLKIAERIVLKTPDPYINTLGGVLGIAADAIWEDPSYLHGAIAWRMRLNAWRGAYVADVLGWHDRARKHFTSYALSQVITPLTAPLVMDTALHLARHLEKLGTSLFSSGYICRNPNGDFRPHHYDMNLVFVDQLLSHFYWSGDTAYVKQMWPLLKRHFDWEKRNFDKDGDGLYDAYAAIWASDALQYSGGAVTHSSAYNFRANKLAAELAMLIGENPAPYKKGAEKILAAINKHLWMPAKGSYAEYKDLLGLKLQHPSAGIWTIYHSIDSRITDPFQAYQSLKYIDNEIPRIPIKANGLTDTSLYTISTSNWQPYTWSINNVALAEVMHTALAYWQGGRPEEAFKLWKSSLIESMYLSSSAGNLQQLSFYDAVRGELYRDFADPVAMVARSMVEGLFGVQPDALNGKLVIEPGLPLEWDYASLSTPDFSFDYRKSGDKDIYKISQRFQKMMRLSLRIKAKTAEIESIVINGKTLLWSVVNDAIEIPIVQLEASAASEYNIEINWGKTKLDQPTFNKRYAQGEVFQLTPKTAVITAVNDPQKVVGSSKFLPGMLRGIVVPDAGHKTLFVKLKQGKFSWWMPVSFNATKPVEIIAAEEQEGNDIQLSIQNNFANDIEINVTIKGNKNSVPIILKRGTRSSNIIVPGNMLRPGSNIVEITDANKIIAQMNISNWSLTSKESPGVYERVILSTYFNDEVNNIFKNEYLSPRPSGPTLQLPTQGIGNWCYPLTMASINDSGLRARAGFKNEITISQGIPFVTPSATSAKNIVFTSQWDNYPDSVTIAISGKASHAYFLMAGSTNPMQSRITNGEVIIRYKDGSSEKLQLKNPETWWPIEQDYYVDGYAFTTDAPKPVRVYLKTGEDTRAFKNYIAIKGFSNQGIDGGAATVLDLPLNPKKEMHSLVLKTLTNDVVIGLMSVTLLR